jgi:hypothetical protein
VGDEQFDTKKSKKFYVANIVTEIECEWVKVETRITHTAWQRRQSAATIGHGRLPKGNDAFGWWDYSPCLWS